MLLEPKYYGLIGGEIISDLVDLADYDGNIRLNEKHFPDLNYYQDRDLGVSAKRLKALMLACHLKHKEGEEFLMRFIDEKISQKNEKILLNKINKKFKGEEDQEYARKSIMTREDRFYWFKSLLRFRKRFEDLLDLASIKGRETETEFSPKAFSALTIMNNLSKTCWEYDNIMFLLLGNYALQRLDRNRLILEYGYPGFLEDETSLGEAPF